MLIYGMGNIGTGSSGASIPTPVVSAITLSPAIGTANSSAGTVIGTLAVAMSSGTLTSPVLTLTNTAGGDFQIVNGNQVAVLPNNVPAGSYSITAQVTASNLASPFSQTIAVTMNAQSVVVPTGVGNRFEIVLDQSSVAPGSAASGHAYPNANWPNGGGTITLTPSNGDATIAMTVPSGGNTAIPLTYTPSASAEIDLVPSNNMGWNNPLPGRLTVFAAGSGAAVSGVTISSARADRAGFQYSRLAVRPRGFSFGTGFGPAWFNVSGSMSAMFVRIYDSLSSGATATRGTGTELTAGPVQVHGPISGSGVVRVMLPSAPTEFYVDVAGDAAFTNPVRVPQRLCIGLGRAIFTRSQLTHQARGYASVGQAIAQTYAKARSYVAYDPRYGNNAGDWFVHDGTSTDPYQYHDGADSSAALMEYGRQAEAKLGVLTFITGLSASGGGIDQFINHDGSLCGGFTGTVGNVAGEFRSFEFGLAGWDTTNSSYPSEYPTEGPARMQSLLTTIPANYPGCAVIIANTGDSGWYGPNGSQAQSERRDGLVFRDTLAPNNPMLIAHTDMVWNEFVGGHASQGARVYSGRSQFQAFLDAEMAIMGGYGSGAQGPRLATTGSWNKTTNVLSIPYKGTGLHAIGITFATPNSTVGSATAAEVASLFAVYPGAGAGWGNARSVQISSATINIASPPSGYDGTIDLALVVSNGMLVNGIDSNSANFGTGTQAMPSALTVHFGDFGVSNRTLYPQWQGGPARSAALVDTNDDLSVGYGRQMDRQLDIAVS